MRTRLIFRSLRQHAIGSLFASIGVALATGLLLTVWVLKTQAGEAFSRSGGGFDAVLAARGSRVQIVLNALFHMENATGTVAAADLEELLRNPAVSVAIPLASGDSYQGWRVVGTLPALFSETALSHDRRPSLLRGRLFALGAEEAVIGSQVGARTGLHLGSRFRPAHGVAESGSEEHEENFVVVGELAPTNTPLDRAIWVPLEGVQHLSGHDPAKADALTAILLRFRSPMTAFALDRQYNREGGRLTLAYPVGAVVADLFSKFSWVESVLGGVAWVVAVVAGFSVLAGLTNTLHGRRRDIAILRSLGARRGTVLGLVLGEAFVIGASGVVLGVGVYALLAAAAAHYVRAATGVVLEVWSFDAVFFWAPAGVLLMCLVSGLAPAISAFRLPVVQNLAPES